MIWTKKESIFAFACVMICQSINWDEGQSIKSDNDKKKKKKKKKQL